MVLQVYIGPEFSGPFFLLLLFSPFQIVYFFSSNIIIWVKNDKVCTKMMSFFSQSSFWSEKVEFDDFLMMTWEPEKKRTRKSGPYRGDRIEKQWWLIKWAYFHVSGFWSELFYCISFDYDITGNNSCVDFIFPNHFSFAYLPTYCCFSLDLRAILNKPMLPT